MSDSLPDLIDVEAALRQQQAGIGAAELHGAIAGWIAGGGDPGTGWFARVMADDGLADPAADSVIGRLFAITRAQFDDQAFGLELLVPGERASLAERSGALFDWCRGFLGAFGLAAGANPPLSEEGVEAVADLARFAAASPQDDGDEDDEDALVEIGEFVRVAALLLHGDCTLGPRHRNQLN